MIYDVDTYNVPSNILHYLYQEIRNDLFKRDRYGNDERVRRFSNRKSYRGQSPSGHLVDDQQPAILKIEPFLQQSALY